MPDEQPQQEDAERSEVHARVVQVGCLRQQRMREHRPLQQPLTRQPGIVLHALDPTSPRERAAGAQYRDGGGQLPERVERRDDRGLPQVGDQTPKAPGARRCEPSRNQTCSHAAGLLPVQLQVNHDWRLIPRDPGRTVAHGAAVAAPSSRPLRVRQDSWAMTWMTALISARWVNACGKLPRC